MLANFIPSTIAVAVAVVVIVVVTDTTDGTATVGRAADSTPIVAISATSGGEGNMIFNGVILIGCGNGRRKFNRLCHRCSRGGGSK